MNELASPSARHRPTALSLSWPGTSGRALDFLALTRPRLNLLVIATTLGSYHVGGGPFDAARLVNLVVGTALVAGGAAAFNQILERDTDALMRRTRMRPLPGGRMRVSTAAWFAAGLSAIGLTQLAVGTTLLAAAVAAASLASYTLIYTPLKRRTPLSTLAGGIPGALPTIIGWAAARGTISIEAWSLFAIVFVWQMPHFLAIAWLCREDYARAGLPLLPVVDPGGHSTARLTVLYTAALVPASLAPVLVGLAGRVYFAGAAALDLAFLAFALQFARRRTDGDARRLFLASIVYLPLLWGLMIGDRL